MVGALFLFAISLTACGSQEPHKSISKELGIDVSPGLEVSSTNTHGSMGDGMTYIVLKFSDQQVLEEIRENTQWKAFPLDSLVRTLIYGIEDETGHHGPYVHDGAGNPLIPEIQDGCYIFIDRHPQAGTEEDILSRGSFNFTLGLYDSGTDTLYFCRMDT